MQGIITDKSIRYVCEEERGAEDKFQTKFWIKPKTHAEANKTLSRYGSAGRDSRKGYREFSVNKLNSADYDEWVSTVTKVENFAFPEEFYEEYPEMRDQAKTKTLPDKTEALFIENIEEIWIKKEVLRYLPADVINEIWDVAVDYSKLKEGEKKS